MAPIGLVHFLSALLAMVVGAVVLLMRPKGGRWHRRVGFVYLAAMVTLNVSALMIYRLFGGFGPFHFFAIISLVSLLLGWRAIWQARARRVAKDLAGRALWIEIHYRFMSWSYVGLLAAFASETITRHPAFRPYFGNGAAFGAAVAAATFAVVIVGAIWIRRAARPVLAPFSAPATSSSAAGTTA